MHATALAAPARRIDLFVSDDAGNGFQSVVPFESIETITSLARHYLPPPVAALADDDPGKYAFIAAMLNAGTVFANDANAAYAAAALALFYIWNNPERSPRGQSLRSELRKAVERWRQPALCAVAAANHMIVGVASRDETLRDGIAETMKLARRYKRRHLIFFAEAYDSNATERG